MKKKINPQIIVVYSPDNLNQPFAQLHKEHERPPQWWMWFIDAVDGCIHRSISGHRTPRKGHGEASWGKIRNICMCSYQLLLIRFQWVGSPRTVQLRGSDAARIRRLRWRCWLRQESSEDWTALRVPFQGNSFPSLTSLRPCSVGSLSPCHMGISVQLTDRSWRAGWKLQ